MGIGFVLIGPLASKHLRTSDVSLKTLQSFSCQQKSTISFCFVHFFEKHKTQMDCYSKQNEITSFESKA